MVIPAEMVRNTTTDGAINQEKVIIRGLDEGPREVVLK
jgi:hypothetical protein